MTADSEMRGEREHGLATAIGRLGVWDAGLCFAPAAAARSAAAELEAAGYGAAWLHEGGRDAFVGAAILLEATRSLTVGTSIASIWRHEPDAMVDAARTLGEAFPGRFVLGIGIAHAGAASWRGRAYNRPFSDLSDYLDAMGVVSWPGPRPDPPVPLMIAALGPRMLELARRRSRGAIPYLVPVEHTRLARAALGTDPVLAVQQAIVVDQPRQRAGELAREFVARYLPWPNYRSNLLRCGFAERDLEDGGSDRLIDALVAIGDTDTVAARVQAHLDAGADHVCVDPLGRAFNEVPIAQLCELAAKMGDSAHALQADRLVLSGIAPTTNSRQEDELR
ncbi:MAG TPA: TIGR03620 family F420-dependent LLM class oxidoreductase [Gaiellaceae bacterium]|nr:TIGR03620 family F420-dependent LLM class oxidoreductase [Gaiellaceae bacterium]